MLDVLLNFIIVQLAIILFMAPFFIWYKLARRKTTQAGGQPEPFNHQLEDFFSTRQANWLVFLWAAGEAVIWFVIPEFLLLLMVFMRVRNKRQLLLYDIYGTIAGALTAYVIHLSPAGISRLPYIQEKMVSQVQHWYETMGVWGLVHQPFSGVPFKVFTHSAPDYAIPLLLFLLIAVVVRISRYVVAYGVFVAIYPVLHRHVRRNYIPLFIIATFIFSLLLLKVYRNYA